MFMCSSIPNNRTSPIMGISFVLVNCSMSKLNILILEDDNWYGEFLKHHVNMNPDFEATLVSDYRAFKQSMNDTVDVVCLDYNIPEENGLKILEQLKIDFPKTEVIVISGQSNVSIAIEIFRIGVFDYLLKEEDTKDRLWNSLIKLTKVKSLEDRIEQLEDEVQLKNDFGKTIIGYSPEIKQIFRLAEKAANSSINVSISGETGTGKEVMAKAIHYNSARRTKPFIAINVSAIPENLIESELFGHEKGAFTGAIATKKGKFELANGGTLFLDEVAEMSMSLQTKLLRILQEKEFFKVGGEKLQKVSCRIICASHKDLLEEVGKGNFREDLYYRLFGLPIKMPSLRSRHSDIAVLAKHFIKEFSKENNIPMKLMTNDASSKLLSYSFPGNVRELKAVIDLAMVLSEDEIGPEDLKLQIKNPLFELGNEDRTMREYQIDILNFYLKKYDDNVIEVSEKLNLGKSTIYRMLKE